MNWNSNWSNPSPIEVKPVETPTPINPTPTNEWDSWSQDQVLMHWKELKDNLADIKEKEMEFRKYIVSRAFPNADEGTNTLELGGGYELKAVVKYNYKLEDNDKVEAGLNAIAKLGNMGSFVADRLVHWTPTFQKSEYNTLLEDAEKGSGEARAIIVEVNKFLVIDDAAPQLLIKEPRKKK